MNDDAHIHYENFPSALDIATVALVFQTVTKKCYFHADPQIPRSRITPEEQAAKVRAFRKSTYFDVDK